MSLETLDTHTPSKPVVAVAQVATPADVAPRSLSAADEHGPLAAEDVDTILYEMTDPLNRYYRYPVAKGMLPLFMRLPFTPNQITAFHACLGLTAGVLIARGTPRDLVVAFFLADSSKATDHALTRSIGPEPCGLTSDDLRKASPDLQNTRFVTRRAAGPQGRPLRACWG